MKGIGVEVVDIRKINGDGNLKAFADVKIGDSLIIKGFSVMKGRQGVQVLLPRKPSKDGKWFDILTPLSDELKREFEDRVMEAYDREVDAA